MIKISANARPAVHVIGPSIAYIPLTKGKFALIESADSEYLQQWNWCVNENLSYKTAYAVRSELIQGSRRTKKHLMHRQLLLLRGMATVKHLNGNGLDNRRLGNLAPTMIKLHKPSSAKVQRGVHQHLPGVWRAQITVSKRRVYLGCYSSWEEACSARIKRMQLVQAHEMPSSDCASDLPNVSRP